MEASLLVTRRWKFDKLQVFNYLRAKSVLELLLAGSFIPLSSVTRGTVPPHIVLVNHLYRKFV